MNEKDRDWFAPLWRRVLVTAIVLAWTGWEWGVNRDPFWGMLTLGLAGYAVWSFFIAYNPPEAKKEDGNDGRPEG